MRDKYLNIGTDCIVNVPKSDVENFAIVGKYNGKAMKVVKKVMLGNGLPYFELDGAVSDKGVPYGFVREWLVAF